MSEPVTVPVTHDHFKQVPLFEKCNQATIDELLKMLKPKSFRKGQEIVTHNAVAKEMFFVMDGEVDIFSSSSTKIDRAGKGTFFGELGLVYSIPRTATVVAHTDVQVWVLEKQDFEKIKASNPAIKEVIQSIAESRFMRFQRILTALASTPEGENFPVDQLAVFREVFCYFDRDNDGKLDLEGLGEMLKRLSGKDFTKAEVSYVQKGLDTHHTEGTVFYSDFVLKLRYLAWLCDPTARPVRSTPMSDDEYSTEDPASSPVWFILAGISLLGIGFGAGYFFAKRAEI